jgi:competence protein ComEC
VPLAGHAGEMLRAWTAAEVGPGRLAPWLAVAFACGIALYFAAEREPLWWAACVLAVACACIAIAVRRRPVAFPLAVGAAAIAAGLAAPAIKAALCAHPVLERPAFGVQLSGWVEMREQRERTDRIVLRVHRIATAGLDARLERVRISVRKGTAPPVGSFVSLTARLNPPLPPLRPGGYDFARDLYFQNIAASGFALGAIRTPASPTPVGGWLRLSAAIEGLRDAVDRRIRAAVPGDRGAIASALITGKRDAISSQVNDAMYVSSLGHILSISGYHMAVVTGLVFFALRALLACFPALATRYAIKKFAALAALAAAAFYLVLSGAAVATQRSFIMVAIVLIGVMLDRQALTLRTLTLAALTILFVTPEALVHPSFQMSFAATLALVAGYQHGLPWPLAGRETSLRARIALWGGRQIVGILVVSLLAGLATTLYAAYHFHRLAPYGVLANLLAMPIVSLWIMPSGIFGLLLAPLGFDGPMWRLMGEGIGWMTGTAQWVASLPGSVGHIAAFGTGPLLLGSAGLIVVCLLKTPLRWSGAILVALASIWAVRTPLPDILVAADGRLFAVRGASGQLAFLRTGSDGFVVREWLAADGDMRAEKEALAGGFACDAVGCIARLRDGTVVAVAREAAAFAEDCRRARIVLSPRDAPGACAALTIDRKVWRHSGALAIRQEGDRFVVTATRPAGGDRPWARARAPASDDAVSPASSRRSPAADATPRADDLEAGD